MSVRDSKSPYLTDSEKHFLDHLGNWFPWHQKKPNAGITRLSLLKDYQKSMQIRDNWGDINVVDIQRHVLMLIQREEVMQS